MKISKKILGTFAAFLLAACGAEVDQNEIHKISDGSYNADPQGEGFGLSGPDWRRSKPVVVCPHQAIV